MAVLKKTRITELLTAEAGIKLSGGVLTAPSGTINNLTSNTITVNTNVNVGSNTTLTSDSISTNAAEFNTITATTYNNLPRADETTEGIVMLSDTYSSGASNTAASVIALSEFATSVEDRIEEFELDIRGSSEDAYNKEPPTLYSVKAYADYMSITGGSVNTSIPDNGTMTLKKTGASSLTLSLKNFALQSNLETLREDVDALSGTSGSLSALADRVTDLEEALPIDSFRTTPVYTFINNRLGWSDSSTVQSKINDLNNSLSTSITELENNLSDQILNITNNLIPGLSNDIETIRTISTGARDLAQSTSDNLMALEGILRVGQVKYEATALSEEGKTVDISLSKLGISIQDAPYLTYIVTLNGFVLKGATSFPSTQTQTSSNGAEYIFINGGSDTNSYIRTVNTLLANQEFMVYAFGYRYSEINGVSATNLNNISVTANSAEVKKAAKLLW